MARKTKRCKKVPAKPGRKSRFTPARIIEVIHKQHGLLWNVAQALNCSAQTIRNYRKEYPQIEEAFIDARSRTGDTAESKLIAKINRGDLRAIRYYLSHQCRDRGYDKEIRHTHSGRIATDGMPDAERIARIAALLATARDRRAAATAEPVAEPIPS